jgi:hypothetical protein
MGFLIEICYLAFFPFPTNLKVLGWYTFSLLNQKVLYKYLVKLSEPKNAK